MQSNHPAIHPQDYSFRQSFRPEDILTISDPGNPLVKRKAAAGFLNRKPNTLAIWDCTKRYDLGPVRYGKDVYYPLSCLIEHRNEQLKPA